VTIHWRKDALESVLASKNRDSVSAGDYPDVTVHTEKGRAAFNKASECTIFGKVDDFNKKEVEAADTIGDGEAGEASMFFLVLGMIAFMAGIAGYRRSRIVRLMCLDARAYQPMEC